MNVVLVSAISTFSKGNAGIGDRGLERLKIKYKQNLYLET